jgi:hypothetical protein
VYKAFARGAHVTLGKRQRLDSLDLSKVAPDLRGRYGKTIPIDLQLITPASIANDPQLRLVATDFRG